MVRSLPANAGGHGFDPYSGNISHVMGQINRCTTTTEPVCLEPVLCNKRHLDNEKPVFCNEE